MAASKKKEGKDGASPSGPPFYPPLYLQRAQKILQVLQEHECRSFIDAGCSSGELLRFLLFSQLRERSFSHVVAIDVDEVSLLKAGRTAPPPVVLSSAALLRPMHIDFVQGDLTRSPRFSKRDDHVYKEEEVGEDGYINDTSLLLTSPHFDAVISIEVLEHINAREVPAYTDVIFGHLAAASGARIVVITTPNRDRNVYGAFEKKNGDVCLDGLPHSHISSEIPYAVRHADHKFEMTAAQFGRYCDYVVEAYRPLWASYTLFGVGDNFTQGAVFHASSSFVRRPAVRVVKPSSLTFEAVKSVLLRKQGGVTRPLSGHAPSPPSAAKSGLRWVHDSASRARLFPWEDLFGELSTQPSDVMLSLERAACNYRCLVSVKVPYRSLWKRIRDVVCEAFSCAMREMEYNSRHDNFLRFGDVATVHEYLLSAPFNASLCALMVSLLDRLRLCRERLKRGCFEPQATKNISLRIAEDVSFVLRWLLHECWGCDTVTQCLKDDTYGSAAKKLSQTEKRLVLFLVSVGVVPGAALHLSEVLKRVRWSNGGTRRRGATTMRSRRGGGPPSQVEGIASSPERRAQLRHLVDALSDCWVPRRKFMGTSKS
ncbi:methyltransferase type 12 [Trypanosoma grayi]|uniref:methyltransferase type 12 n=1 Tax=Trypanosoma grayi TaxID=71804 RepID=UPI0004F45DD3|nr:methyltransferase type 12 [Trypanosoma grayi]KEG06932.1 methyltransferase type 12 [Trypanosoma grayi]